MHRINNLENESIDFYSDTNNSLIDNSLILRKNSILTSIYGLINLNMESFNVNFKFSICTDSASSLIPQVKIISVKVQVTAN